MTEFQGFEYFDSTGEEDRVAPMPDLLAEPRSVWDQLAESGITEDDVREAVAWARSASPPPSGF